MIYAIILMLVVFILTIGSELRKAHYDSEIILEAMENVKRDQSKLQTATVKLEAGIRELNRMNYLVR